MLDASRNSFGIARNTAQKFAVDPSCAGCADEKETRPIHTLAVCSDRMAVGCPPDLRGQEWRPEFVTSRCDDHIDLVAAAVSA